ncbi:MAG TPA: hypothetical protein VKU38_05490 [Ktedonobacteraceae bacterium]|nr:hypothetical protein [Ktedonobacteraceae bacterium]
MKKPALQQVCWQDPIAARQPEQIRSNAEEGREVLPQIAGDAFQSH